MRTANPRSFLPLVLALTVGGIIALAQPTTEWRIPAAEVGGPLGMQTDIRVANVSANEGAANVTLLFEDGRTAERVFTVPPLSWVDVSIGREFPHAQGRRFSVVIQSSGPPAELVVDWALYATAGGLAVADGTPTSSAWRPLSDGSAMSPQGADDSALQFSTTAVTNAGAATYNIRVVSDASPDLTDLDSLIYSATSRWPENRDKVWALYYWTHVLRRQTAPMVLHGFEVTDPIRNFVDFGNTMCSTVSGMHQTMFEALGLRHQYWDICRHTVSAVEYDGKFRMVDGSMSNLVTTDDGVTLATVEEAAADSARLVRERSLSATSANGFLTGSDHIRHLPDAVDSSTGAVALGYASSFCSDGLKRRDFYYHWDAGHRYVLNLRENESYTRYYRRLGTIPEYWVGSEHVASPDPAQTFEIDSANRFGLRGNGAWSFSPGLTPEAWERGVYRSTNVVPVAGGGLRPQTAGQPAEILYKVQAANAIASQTIRAQFARSVAAATATVAVSLNHGATWTEVGALGLEVGSAVPFIRTLRNEVTGSYETLIRIRMHDAGSAGAVTLTALTIDTITHLNARALPKLNIGRNEIYVGLGEQSDTTVLWPDLRGDRWKRDVYDFKNIASQSVDVPREYTAVAYPAVLSQEAHLTYRMDAPNDITRFVYGGRLHNYRAGSYIDFLHSFDRGATWIRSYRLSDINAPWDVIHYETVTDIPPGVRTVLFKFLIHNTETSTFRASGLYSVRMEASYRPAQAARAPIDVTLRWKEVQSDRSLVERSHRQRLAAFPFNYVVNVGGSDHPVMESMKLAVADDSDTTPFGYNDGADAGGQKYVFSKRTDGTNLATARPYTFSRAPSGFQSSAPASNTTILTDGVVGAPATGGRTYWWGQCWSSGANVDLQIDLGGPRSVAAFRAHLFGYPFWEAFNGEVLDRVEIFTSLDGLTFSSQGLLQTLLWRKDVPINYMVMDDGKATAWNFERRLASPVSARFVRYRATPMRILCASELQVFDRILYEPFDIRIALPTPAAPAPEPPANQTPRVTITTPIANATFTAPASIALAADASDPDGIIQRVDFVAGTTPIGSATTSPFATTWRDVPAGRYVLTARATDNAGASTPSAPVTITVQLSSSPPPGEIDEIVLHAAVQPHIAGGWAVTSDATGASGARLQSPDKNVPKLTAALAAPEQAFELTFTAQAGKPYRLWLRAKALGDSYTNDSVFVQFDNSVDGAGAPVWRIGTTSATHVILEECTGCGLQGWGWADNAYGLNALGPLVYFATSGPQRIRVQTREDGLGIDHIVLSAVKYRSTAPGAAKNDATILPPTAGSTPAPAASAEVVLYPAIDAQVAGGWAVVADASAAAGARLQSPDAGQPKLTTPLAAPTQAFEVTFAAEAGKPYRLWLRGKALANSYTNDSVFVQFDGSVDRAGTPVWRIGTSSATSVIVEDCTGCGLQGWGWADNAYGLNALGPTVYFATSGPQRLRVQTREDGLGIDQIVLSSVAYLSTSPGATKNDTVVVVKP